MILDVLRWAYIGVVAVLALAVCVGLVRHLARRLASRRAVEQAEAAAYREHRCAQLKAADGRDLGRLVGRSARRRAEIHVVAHRRPRVAELSCGHSFAEGIAVPRTPVGAAAYCPVCRKGEPDHAA